jgi:catechol 2,3-dioxygenase-like lactoylglutathione lyase family enzyme
LTRDNNLQFWIFTMQLSPAIPILRIFAEDKAKEFYLDFLGFTLAWEHRFEANFPLYVAIKRSDLTLHLSEHHGDATPGSTIFVPMKNIDAFQQELKAKNYKYAKPAIQDLPWGRMMEVADPFGNKIRFCELPD